MLVYGESVTEAARSQVAFISSAGFEVEVTAELAQVAGELVQAHGLRGYHAVHLAAAVIVADGDLTLVTGVVDLAAAAGDLGLPVDITSG